jgi:hypothetical protein
MRKYILSLLFIFIVKITTYAQNFQVPYFNSNANQTPTYYEIVKYYTELQKSTKNIRITLEFFDSDVSEKILLVKISKGDTSSKVNVLINNGIHPGEPEGIDASMILLSNLINITNGQKITKQKYFNQRYDYQNTFVDLLDYMNLYIIPVYNVDGCLRRNSSSRANQNGPEEYGFRANSQNLDLNRDFIKMDSRNAKSFARIFHKVKPHVFIDTHTSNGADYQHIVTYIATQRDKLNKNISDYQYNAFIPTLNSSLKKYSFDAVPYVNAWSNVPDSGWAAFYESPRFATGYSTLFNTIGFTLETHMLKNYQQRVEGSYAFLFSCLEIIKKDAEKIKDIKQKADQEILSQISFPLNWKLDSTKLKYIEFKGYEASYKKSELSGLNRLYYDRTKPFTKQVKYYEHYKTTKFAESPKAYVIPQQWKAVVERLILNNVQLVQVQRDTTINCTVYYIDDYKTVSKPYEGHYVHSNVSLKKETQRITLAKGDYLVYTNQLSNRYIVECLEPEAIDSYFNWNFFDAVLAQKEYFSDYVFEETAAELVKNNPELKLRLEEEKKKDQKFANSAAAQLDFIYRNSSYFEKSYLRYPVYRIEK